LHVKRERGGRFGAGGSLSSVPGAQASAPGERGADNGSRPRRDVTQVGPRQAKPGWEATNAEDLIEAFLTLTEPAPVARQPRFESSASRQLRRWVGERRVDRLGSRLRAGAHPGERAASAISAQSDRGETRGHRSGALRGVRSSTAVARETAYATEDVGGGESVPPEPRSLEGSPHSGGTPTSPVSRATAPHGARPSRPPETGSGLVTSRTRPRNRCCGDTPHPERPSAMSPCTSNRHRAAWTLPGGCRRTGFCLPLPPAPACLAARQEWGRRGEWRRPRTMVRRGLPPLRAVPGVDTTQVGSRVDDVQDRLSRDRGQFREQFGVVSTPGGSSTLPGGGQRMFCRPSARAPQQSA
jgi:hypothetical protein